MIFVVNNIHCRLTLSDIKLKKKNSVCFCLATMCWIKNESKTRITGKKEWLLDLKIHCYEIKLNFPSNFSLMPQWGNTMTLNATNPITIRVMASNAADHKHNITRVSQFAPILSFRELLRHRRLFHLPAALLCVPAYFELSYHLWSRLSSGELGLWWEWVIILEKVDKALGIVVLLSSLVWAMFPRNSSRLPRSFWFLEWSGPSCSKSR